MTSSASTLATGKQAEESACRYLLENGLKLIEKNYKCRSGEIDLIMRHNDSIVFVEVRYRHNNRFGSGAESVVKRKQDKLISAALHYIQTHGKSARSASRFDVISIRDSFGKDHIEWIQNAFQA